MFESPESMGMGKPVYGVIPLRKFQSTQSQSNVFTSELRVGTLPESHRSPDEPLSRTGGIITVSNGKFPNAPLGLNSTQNGTSRNIHDDRISIADREALFAAQAELRRTQEEILALEHAIRKARLF